MIDWLDYNGYTVVTKATKEFIDRFGRRKVKGNMDIELAVDAMELAENIDQMVLFSGDGDLVRWSAVQRRGVRVTVVSTIASQPPMIADEVPSGGCLHRPGAVTVQTWPRSKRTSSCARASSAHAAIPAAKCNYNGIRGPMSTRFDD